MTAPKAERCIDAQQSLRTFLRCAEQFRQLVDLIENPARVLEVQLALGREHHPARRAVDQRDARAALHLRQVLADGCRRQAQFARRRAQAAGRGKGREKAQIGRLDGVAHRFHL